MAMRQDASTGKMVEVPDAEGADKPASGKPTMAVKIYAPFHIFYDGEAESVTAVNESGPFDILPRHHNFLCMLVPCSIRVRTSFDEQSFKVERALMHVKADKVVVFVDV